MTSTLGSTTHSPRAIRRAAVVVHHDAATVEGAVARVERVASEHDVDLDGGAPEIAIVLGGDGTMLEGLHRFLGTGVPVLGVNFGRVGFLTSVEPERLEVDLARVFAGEYVAVELATLEAEAGDLRRVAVNDVVATSSRLGRMIELDWSVGGEELGRIPCDGIVCATPAGSTAYNLSIGGPVLVRGLEAMAVSFAAPHSLHARPLVVPRGLDVGVVNATPGLAATLLVDGRPAADLRPGARVVVRVGAERSLLATLPETTFFSRYRATFTH